MALINLTTNLKSLKFGHDESGGGSSDQPYIQTAIPATNEQLNTTNDLNFNISYNPDPSNFEVLGKAGLSAIGAIADGLAPIVGPILLYSGILNTARIIVGGIEDGTLNKSLFDFSGTSVSLKPAAAGTGGPDWLIRGGGLLPKAVTNDFERITKFFKSTEGNLFILKQNILSKSALPSQSTRTISSNTVIGGFLNPANLNPLIYNEGIYNPINTLAQVIGGPLGLHLNKQGLIGGGPGDLRKYSDVVKNTEIQTDNRLIRLYGKKFLNDNPSNISLDYIGTDPDILFNYPGGPNSILGIGRTRIRLDNPSVKTNLVNDITNPEINYYTLGYNQLMEAGSTDSNIVTVRGNDNYFNERSYKGYIPNLRQRDFRQKINEIIKPLNNNESVIQDGEYNPYNSQLKSTIESRYLLGDPGNPLDKKVYGTFVGNNLGNTAGINSYDKLNLYPIYKTNPGISISNNTSTLPDLIPFRIGIIDYQLLTDVFSLGSEDVSLNNVAINYIQFRAYLDQISDTYSTEWQDYRYLGRGEKFYNYTGFDRKVSLSWTVYAQSQIELKSLYNKLNYLASACAPNYSETGYMRGNFVVLSIGGYFIQQLGIITGFSYEMNDSNATWDTEYELPHMIKVSGFNFIPIHNFVPKLQSIKVNNILEDDLNTDYNLDNIEDKNEYNLYEQYIDQNKTFNITVNVEQGDDIPTLDLNNQNNGGGLPPDPGTVPDPPDNSAPPQNQQQIINDILGDTP